MRIPILILAACLGLAACKPQQGGNNNGNAGNNGNTGNGNNGNAKTYTVSGQVTQTSSYCGGAAPSEEILERYRTPKPFPDLELHVRAGATNDLAKKVIASTKTDAEGRFSFQLPAGEYCIIISERLKLPDPASFPPKKLMYVEDCFKEWVLNCDATLKVEAADLSVPTFNLHHNCFSSYFSRCIRYTGPMPP